MNPVAMKTIQRPHHLFCVFLCSLAALTAISCQTTSSPTKITRVPMSVTGTKWVKVSSQPPNYYPRGVAANCKTDHWSGEWIETGDEKGTRYFIPLHGLGMKRDVLIREALAARSARKLDQVEVEEREKSVRNVRSIVIGGPPLVTCIMLCGMVGAPGPSYEDFQRLGKEWHETKQPASRHGW
jgi:hypothetical protein